MRCQAEGRDGTRLGGCVKTRVPWPDGRWGIVLVPIATRDGTTRAARARLRRTPPDRTLAPERLPGRPPATARRLNAAASRLSPIRAAHSRAATDHTARRRRAHARAAREEPTEMPNPVPALLPAPGALRRHHRRREGRRRHARAAAARPARAGREPAQDDLPRGHRAARRNADATRTADTLHRVAPGARPPRPDLRRPAPAARRPGQRTASPAATASSGSRPCAA